MLTQHLNRFETMVAEFDYLQEEIPQPKKIRHANILCTQVEKIKTAQQNLEDNAEKLMGVVYQLHAFFL